MPPRAKHNDAQDGQDGSAAHSAANGAQRAQERSPSADEKALDPKLAEHPDASDGEMEAANGKRSQRSTQGTSRAGKRRKVDDAQQGRSQNGAASAGNHSADAAGEPNQNDWNPTPGKLPPDDKTPLDELRELIDSVRSFDEAKKDSQGSDNNVLYVMGMKSLRIEDNRGLARASELAQARGSSLVVLFVISPQDWKMHDRGPRRIDFVLRNLRIIRAQLDELHIPLVVYTEPVRKRLPAKVLEIADKARASALVGSVEYEVDEIWRDAKLLKMAHEQGKAFYLFEDTYIVPAGQLATKQGKPYSVFSPWNRAWTAYLSKNLDLVDEAPIPKANDPAVRKGDLKSLFSLQEEDGFGIPEYVEGFQCKDTDYMQKLWPAGSHAARQVLDNFVRRKGGESGLEEPATGESWADVGPNAKDSRLNRYGIGRNLMSENGTSRLSPYLAAGVLSARACLRATMAADKNRLNVGRSTGVEMWNTEISFRDFYGHVLAAWPRVCMNRAFIPKYEAVAWEYDDGEGGDQGVFQRWTEGRTGYPIVDAAMRQAAKQGYMHNRGRMQVAMFLTKHLMHDWREGERWFNQTLIDQDFASNNAGWQWSASTGSDPQPYFRIFNPVSQSEKCDPRGEYIRHWVPELRDVKGAAVHFPYERLSKQEFQKLGYPAPMVDHKEARERALRRFKNPGDK